MTLPVPDVKTLAALVLLVSFLIFISNLGKWSKAENAPNKPLTITLSTPKTPAEVMFEAQAAKRRRQTAVFLLLIGCWIAFRLWQPELAMSIQESAAQAAVRLLQVVADLIGQMVRILEAQ